MAARAGQGRSVRVVCRIAAATASRAWTLDYEWSDDAWMESRGHRAIALEAPMSIYEMHLGSWRREDHARCLGIAILPNPSPTT
jgi:1,4-alpha-glucan branching enzyme